jgi:hypothetical protein
MKYRQGDVLIVRIDTMPEGIEPVPRDNGRVILAYGEVTGHVHAVEGDVALFAPADVAELEERFLRVEREARLVHEEHEAITLPPGIYSVRRQREYTPERVRPVAD